MDDNLKLWEGEFGDEYTERNRASYENLEARRHLFLEIIGKAKEKVRSIAEIGAGCGANLRALRYLVGPTVALTAVEPNQSARNHMTNDIASLGVSILSGSAGEIPLQDAAAELVFTSGCLIHIPPTRLGKAMDEIHRVSSRWIAAIEYFSPEITEVEYRGQRNVLWKADYGSLYLERFPDLRCVAYGFEWRRATGLDNVTWFLLEKLP